MVLRKTRDGMHIAKKLKGAPASWAQKEIPVSFVALSPRKILPILMLLVLAGVAVSAAAAQTSSDPNPPTATKPSGKHSTKPDDPAPGTDAQKPAQGTDVYRIGIDDQIQISVWREHDLSLTVVVRPDGMITMPLLNDLYVIGLTPRELADSLTEKLKPFVNEPQVTVSVQQIRSRRVYLIGQVTHPGAYALNDRKTVLELLTEAGGVGQFAKQNSIYILRSVNGKSEKIPFRYKDAIIGKGNGGDVELLPGDRVIVP
jgi:polysaccharide biosynthesis/export protein